MELIQQLTQQLGINQQQASGGVGMIMGLAKNKLGGDFGRVAQHVPGVEGMIASAPSPQASSGSAGGIGAAVGSIGGLLGGSGAGGAMAQLGSLAGGFRQLGMDPGMIGRFVTIVIDYFKSRDGQSSSLLQRAVAA